MVEQLDNLVLFRNLKGCVVSSYNDKLWIPEDPKVLEEIERTWKEKGNGLTNGPLVRVNSMNPDEKNILNVAGQKTDYKSHLGTKDREDLPAESRAMPLYVAANLITNDNFLVFLLDSSKKDDSITTFAKPVRPNDINGLDFLLQIAIFEKFGLKVMDLADYMEEDYL